MRKWLLSLVFSLLAVQSALAFNLDFLKYSPAFYFTNDDWDILQKAAVTALDGAKDNAKVTWRNPQTGANGYFIPYATSTNNGLRCRMMKMYEYANHVTGAATYRFCKVNGEWKIDDPD